MRYRYTEAQLARAIELALASETHQALTNMRNPFGRGINRLDGEWWEINHAIGTLGQIIASDVTGRPFVPGVGLADDVWGGIEVRTRRIPGSGCDLLMHQFDAVKLARPWALVHIFIDQPFEAAIPGWIWGYEGAVPSFKKMYGRYAARGGAYFIPPDADIMKPIAELAAMRGQTWGSSPWDALAGLRKRFEAKRPRSIVGWRGGSHLCHCGAYGTRGNLARPGEWRCAAHEGGLDA